LIEDPIHDKDVQAALIESWEQAHATRPLTRRVHSTGWRVGVQAINMLSNILGDDVLGRSIRRWLFSLGGARLAPKSWIHGGTWISNPANLTMGVGAGLNRDCYLDLEGRIEFGVRSGTGHGATFITSVHPLIDSLWVGPIGTGDILVEPGGWVGANATILPGVTVGCHAVVAAGAVVTHDVAPHTVVAGVPAKLLREGVLAPDRCPIVSTRATTD
jgi:acetyltransferase-like isoleucine patch superfamily enzyme